MAEISNSHWIIILIFNCLVYGICCLMIIKRKNFTYISIRSPTLLLFTNFSNFLASIFLIFHKLTDSNFITIFYYVFRSLMLASIILRFERIFLCFKINLEKFNQKRYLLQEKFYARILVGFALILTIFLIIINSLANNCVELFYSKNKNFKSQMKLWVFWNFLEQFIIITYIFRIINKRLKHYLSVELYSFFIIWLLYTNYFSYIYLNEKNDDIDFIFLSLFVLYLCLIINGFIPIIMSICSTVIISYSFTPKLINNLYLFLANEDCYQSFNEYLIAQKNNGSFYLKLYTYIMKFKLDTALNLIRNKTVIVNEAREIFNIYFNSENYSQLIPLEIIQRVRDKSQILNLNSYNSEMFDDGLQYTYNELNKRFIEYKNCKIFKELLEEIKLISFIQCKMCNTGLINKF